ncbi:glycoside hydrolase family 88 protein [Vallitalea pronyensis]|uniref:Glycoside hydrolase family 88 protein n=1 Tax=Vallitalea pronyensis TaxID=1348613 RepID=A0A8J8MN68_9FIRM|nr:glycoside hydrolase family 88 protein [Vallitalea pronyensis]QUI24631.1 glycoside hydrolase family 88 protein [Vallitalea pronyensis]
MKNNLEEKINVLSESFKKVLYTDDVKFLDNMENNNLGGDDISKYRFWEWTQGVGLYGFWKLFQHTKNTYYLETLEKYYEERFKEGLPSKNINTTTPMLTLANLCEFNKNPTYLDACISWAEWIMHELPRTKEGGFQHMTSDTLNDQELWDDTLFMTVLFLAKMGKMTDNRAYIEEAKYQFLLHIKYLAHAKTGLWYHGWTFNGSHNFVKALWGRGNCWVTMAIPEFIEMIELEDSMKKYLMHTLERQVISLRKFQNEEGMWHTLIDDKESYAESSATAGFGYGILKACRLGILDEKYRKVALKAIEPILKRIDKDGVVKQVSYGTPMGRDHKDFYKNIPLEPMPYGQALALLFFIEGLMYQDANKKAQ